VAAEVLFGDGRSRNEIPEAEQPDADQVRWINARVRRRLGLDGPVRRPEDRPPVVDQLLTLLEITVLGFWRDQVVAHAAHPGRELDIAARRLVEAAHLVFWSQASGHPTPLEAMTRLLARRLDQTFRRADLTREVLDDVGDEEIGVARWLVFPDDWAAGGFRVTIGRVYSELLTGTETDSAASVQPAWAVVLGISPPFHSGQVRSAYRAKSKQFHPDTGGDHEEFIRLQSAYEQAQQYCTARGL
jgi:hypothetical protein